MSHTTQAELHEEVSRLRHRIAELERQQRDRPHVTLSFIDNGAEGQSRQGAVGVHDIHEHGETDDEFRTIGKRYYDLYENAPDMFASVDAATGRILDCNNTLLVATGYSKNEIPALPHISNLYCLDAEEARTEVFNAFVATGSVRDVELKLFRKDGTAIDVSLSLSAVRDDK